MREKSTYSVTSAIHPRTGAQRSVIVDHDGRIYSAGTAWLQHLGIDEITAVDKAFLDNATAERQIGRSIPIPGIGGGVRAEPDFLLVRVT